MNYEVDQSGRVLVGELVASAPGYVLRWGHRAFVPTRDTGLVSKINELAIDMYSLEASWVALLTEDAVRKGVVNRDALRMWGWSGRVPVLKSCVRDCAEDWDTFTALCRILADHAGELDSGVLDVLHPLPAGDGSADWMGARELSLAAFPVDVWVDKHRAREIAGVSERTLYRWGKAGHTTVRRRGVINEWLVPTLYAARSLSRINEARGRKQNAGRDEGEVRDEVLDKLAGGVR